MQVLELVDIDNIFVGQSYYSTGGAYSLAVQRELFAKARSKEQVALIQIDEIEEKDVVFCVGTIGASLESPVLLTKYSNELLKAISAVAGKAPRAVCALEAGVESLAIVFAQILGIPLLDADVCGGRAVPKLETDNFYLHDISMAPYVICNHLGEITILHDVDAGPGLDAAIRASYGKGSLALIADHIVSMNPKIAACYTKGTISRAKELGAHLSGFSNAPKDLRGRLEARNFHFLASGQIAKLTTLEDKGFFSFVYELNRDDIKVYVKNETIAVTKNEESLLTAPDGIVVLDDRAGVALHSRDMREGLDVSIYAFKAEERWRSEKALQLFSPRSLGIDVDIKLL